MNFHTSPLSDYTESQLLALPANSRLLFAEDLSSGLLTYDTPPPQTPCHHHLRRRILTPPDPTRLPQALSHIKALRCMQHGMSAFSLYPTTDHQHAVNKFLWKAANDHSFSLAEAAKLFQRNVFIISMPAPLFDCLTHLTWPQLEDALFFVLVSLAHDHNGWQLLRDELAAPLAARLTQFPPPLTHLAHRCDPHAFRLLLDLVMDRITWTGPWIMPTTLCFLSASDITELLAARYDRPIFATPEKFEPVHSMMWSIYRDWQTYRQVYVRWAGKTRMEALELMARTISRGAQNLVEQAICTLRALTSGNEEEAGGGNRRSYLAMLPADVVLSKVLPKLCEAYASDDRFGKRRSRPAGTVIDSAGGLQPVRFSLKNWVLEDVLLHQFYHSVEEEMDGEEGSDGDDNEGNTVGDSSGIGWEGNTVGDEEDEDEEVEVVQGIDGEEMGAYEQVEVVDLADVEGTTGIDEEMVTGAVSVVDEVDTDTVVSVESLEGATTGALQTAAAGMESHPEEDVGCTRPSRSQRRRLDEQGSFEVVHRRSSL